MSPLAWLKSALRNQPVVSRLLLFFIPMAFGWIFLKFTYFDAAKAPPATASGQGNGQQLQQRSEVERDLARQLNEAGLAEEMKPKSEEARRNLILGKEEAWQRWYKRPAACETAKDQKTQVDCANHYVKSLREFESQYQAGKIN